MGCVYTSLDEGLPIADVEALRAGPQAMAMEIGECSEIVQGKRILIEGKVSDSISKFMNEMIGLADKIVEMDRKS